MLYLLMMPRNAAGSTVMGGMESNLSCTSWTVHSVKMWKAKLDSLTDGARSFRTQMY